MEKNEKGQKGRKEGNDFDVTVKISGEALKQVMTIRGSREKKTGKITPVIEIVREAIGVLYDRGM